MVLNHLGPLPLKWPRYFPPVGAEGGGSMGLYITKTIFLAEFCDEYDENYFPFQNGGQITDFDFASFRFRQKIEKQKTKNFPKEIVQWNLAHDNNNNNNNEKNAIT